MTLINTGNQYECMSCHYAFVLPRVECHEAKYYNPCTGCPLCSTPYVKWTNYEKEPGSKGGIKNAHLYSD